MIDYDPVLSSLYGWLRKLQITQKTISAHIEESQSALDEDSLEFDLDHPVKGAVRVRMLLPTDEYFRVEGIGLRLAERHDDRAVLDVYDYGGIFDPVDGCVQGEHYSASHLAWMAAVFHADSGKETYLDDARRGVEFYLNTRADGYRFASWGYHHDFNNYAFMETFDAVLDHLSEDERHRWFPQLQKWKNSRNRTSNWCAMRALAYLKRSRHTSSLTDRLRYQCNLLAVELCQLADGCFDDMRGVSRPIQYHAYVAALIGRLYGVLPSERVKRRLIKAARYLTHYVDPDGNFNYKGRGQGQIFGYGAAIYTLELARTLDDDYAPVYGTCIRRMWDYLAGYQQADGHFPLVLTSHADDEGFGWYDYHHTTVYNAFLGVWLALARRVACDHRTDDGGLPGGLVYLEPSGVIRYADRSYFCVLSAGEKQYPADAGTTFDHLWISGLGSVISCPGGPTPESYGAGRSHPNIDVNYSTPLVRLPGGRWISPAHRQARVTQLSDCEFSLSLDYEVCRYDRIIRFEESAIHVRDVLDFVRGVTVEELRLLNLPLLAENVRVESIPDGLVLTGVEVPDSSARAIISVESSVSSVFTVRETIHSAAGIAVNMAVSAETSEYKPGDRVTTEWHITIVGGKDDARTLDSDTRMPDCGNIDCSAGG